MIIGLTGRAGSGKNTVAARLAAVHGFMELALADPLYDMASAMLDVHRDRLMDRAVKEEPIDWLGRSPRELLQLLGTEFGRTILGQNVWIDHLFRRMDRIENAMRSYHRSSGTVDFVVTDVRFENEAAAIRARGGVVWRVVRQEADAQAVRHSSEAGVPGSLVTATIQNAGEIADLHAAVDAAIRSLHDTTMKEVSHATSGA